MLSSCLRSCSDAFPKVASPYKQRSSGGGLATLLLAVVIGLLVWHELDQFLFGAAGWSFTVDRGVAHTLQINVDLTVAMPCHCLFLGCMCSNADIKQT